MPRRKDNATQGAADAPDEKRPFLDCSGHHRKKGDEAPHAPAASVGPAPESAEAGEGEAEGVSIADFSRMIVAILIPVCITMLITVILVRSLNVQTSNAVGTLVYRESAGDSAGMKLGGAILNAAIFLAVILVTTVAFVLLYKYRCIKVLIGWLLVATTLLLGTIGGYFFLMILQAANLPLDWFCGAFFLWNFAVVGVISVFWLAPVILQRAYLITISFLVATYFTQLPEWTTWAVLAVIALYDVFAVLCPKGPLKVLVDLAQTRKEPIPALLYNGSLVMMMAQNDADEAATSSSTTTTPTTATGTDVAAAPLSPTLVGTTQIVQVEGGEARKPAGAPGQQEEEPEEERKGVKLGLGDFVFYSVLVGRAAMFDLLTVFTCFVAIVSGLFGTLLLLALFHRALPALPISIALGICFYFITRFLTMPYITENLLTQTFI